MILEYNLGNIYREQRKRHSSEIHSEHKYVKYNLRHANKFYDAQPVKKGPLWHMQIVNTQISLRSCTIWSGPLLSAYTSRKHDYIILTPLKPHFYIVKLRFTGVYIIFLISAKKT